MADCPRRTKYLKSEDSEVAPSVAQILNARWNAAASMAVMEVKQGCGEFKVTSTGYGCAADEVSMTLSSLLPSTGHQDNAAARKHSHCSSLVCNGVPVGHGKTACFLAVTPVLCTESGRKWI